MSGGRLNGRVSEWGESEQVGGEWASERGRVSEGRVSERGE